MVKFRLPSWMARALCAAALSHTAACFGTVADVHHRHYVLDGSRTNAAEAPGPAPQAAALRPEGAGGLWVKDFQVDAVYDRAQVVRRLSAHEVEFVRDEVWAARLGRMLADAVARNWLAHAHFLTINRTAGEATLEHTLTGEVTAIEVDKTTATPQAHLAWVLQLVATRTGKVLGQHVFDASLPLEGHTNPGEAAAKAFNTLLDEAADAAGRALMQLPAGRSESNSSP